MTIHLEPLRAPLAGAALLCGCAALQPAVPTVPAAQAVQGITEADLLRHIRTLASDEFEGRAPAARGEQLTIDYLVGEFRSAGLSSGNPDGSYLQKVPLVGVTTRATASLRAGERTFELQHKQGFVGGSYQLKPEVSVVDSEMVFVGYGVVAPEYGWDDYKGLDVRGKTLLTLDQRPSGA